MVKVKSAAPVFSRRRPRRGGGSDFGRSGHQMGRGGHRGGAEDEPRLLVESVGVGVAGVGARSEERRVGKECRSRWSPYH